MKFNTDPNKLHMVRNRLGISYWYDRTTKRMDIYRLIKGSEVFLVGGHAYDDGISDLWHYMEWYAEDRPGRWGALHAIRDLLEMENWREVLEAEAA